MSQVVQPHNTDRLRDVYLARQPIFDANLNVVAYEVLFRNSVENRVTIEDQNQATSELLVNAFIEIGLKAVVGEHRAFVNLPREFLTGNYPLPLEADRLVLEILEDVVIDDELLEGVGQLVERGHTIALDDVVFREDLRPLLQLAQIVKVELPAIPNHELANHVKQFRQYPVTLLAEKVETSEEFEFCKALGFNLFQGYFLSRPVMLNSRRPRNSQLAILQLIKNLAGPNFKIDKVERTIQSDVTLTYKMLHYINSSQFGMHHKISSLRQAIMLLGPSRIRTLATLVSLSGFTSKPCELLKTALQRAMFCERIGRLTHANEVQSYFVAGLLSLLDALADMPLRELLKPVPLDEEIKAALLDHDGPLGATVRYAIALERADWDRVPCGTLTSAEIRTAYVESLREVDTFWAEIASE